MKLAKIKLISAECTRSDDEGTNNLADVDRFTIGFTAQDKDTEPSTSTLYNFSTSGDVSVHVGELWDFKQGGRPSKPKPGKALFEDWDSAKLTLTGNAREYDAGSGDEYSGGNKVLSSVDMAGFHTISVMGPDLGFDVKFEVTVQSI